MESTTRATDAPVVAGDDPWAELAAPTEPPLPVPGDVVLPTMPWAEPAPSDAVAPADASTVTARPGPVPTAVAASVLPTSFPPGVAAKLAVYVYLLVDPRTGRPFFVGRGRGDRCFRHVEDARRTAGTSGGPPPGGAATTARFPVLDRIREAESDGRPVRIEILRHGLTVPEAELVVAAVDDALSLGLEPSLGSQRCPAVELGAALAKRAKFKRSHQVVLLRVGAHGTDASYESVRHGWRIGRRWVDTGSMRSPRWAVVVTGDLVDSVYRIDRWEPAPVPPGAGARLVERYSFTGTRDPGLEERYAGRSVSAYLGTGTPSQVTYVWCGPHWVNTAQ
ncbi:MAG: hypothetical protein ABSB09_04500 [Acidimicrobiales bacterium]|jgi:hypothetical protein